MADWKYSDESTTKSKVYNKALYLRMKLRTWVRAAGLVLVLIGVYHFMAPYFAVPVLEVYVDVVPDILAKAKGGSVFQAGHVITIAVGAAIVQWF